MATFRHSSRRTSQRGRRSDGYYHARITYMLTPLAFISGIMLSTITPTQADAGWCALLATLGCLIGVVISPDLDQPSLTHSEWVVLKVPLIGPWLLGPIFVAVWFPYAFLFKHRSVWTHGPVISTIVRAAYMVCAAAAWSWLVPRMSVWHMLSATWQTPGQRWGWGALLSGLMLSDIGHWLRDVGILGGDL